MNSIEWGTTIYSLFFFGLVFLFFISFFYFVFKKVRRDVKRGAQLEEMNQKLDRVIDLLDKQKNKL